METFYFSDAELSDLLKLLGQSVTMLASLSFDVSREGTFSVGMDGSLAIEYGNLNVLNTTRRYVNLENSLRDAGEGRVWDVPKIVVREQPQPRDFKLWYPDRSDIFASPPPGYNNTHFSGVDLMTSTKLRKASKVEAVEVLEALWDDDVSSDSGLRVVFEDGTYFAVAVDTTILNDVKFAFTEAAVSALLKEMSVRCILTFDNAGTDQPG